MAGKRVEVEMQGSVALLTFEGNRDLNLLGSEVVLEFAQALDHLRLNPEVRVVIVKGKGKRAFSAGVDVRELRDLTPNGAEEFIRSLHGLVRMITGFPRPVIASIKGPCLGGALELAMACDMGVASEDAVFGLPEVRVGIPSVIEASLLPLMVGLGRARELILTGDVIDAREALRIGLVNRIASEGDLEQETVKIADAFLNLSPQILGIQKDIMEKWLQMGAEYAAQYSIKAFALCFSSPEPREGIDAFLEKRKPAF